MLNRNARRLLVLMTPLVVAGLTAGNAHAVDVDTSTPVWIDTSEDPTTFQVWDLAESPVEATPLHTAIGVSDTTSNDVANGDGGGCLGWYYEPNTSYGAKKVPRRRGTVYHYNNDSGDAGKIKIENAQEVSIGVTLSASAEVEAGVIVSKVKATFGVSVTAGVKWTTTVGYEQTVGAHRLGHLSGGAIGYQTKGRYYHKNTKCVVDIDYKEITVFTPSYKAYIYKDEPAV